jgi:hypothetical protein
LLQALAAERAQSSEARRLLRVTSFVNRAWKLRRSFARAAVQLHRGPGAGRPTTGLRAEGQPP